MSWSKPQNHYAGTGKLWGNLVRDRWNRGGSADQRKDRDCESINKREAGYCSQVGTFGTESAVRKRGGSRNLPYLNAKPRQIPLLGTYA